MRLCKSDFLHAVVYKLEISFDSLALDVWVQMKEFRSSLLVCGYRVHSPVIIPL